MINLNFCQFIELSLRIRSFVAEEQRDWQYGAKRENYPCGDYVRRKIYNLIMIIDPNNSSLPQPISQINSNKQPSPAEETRDRDKFLGVHQDLYNDYFPIQAISKDDINIYYNQAYPVKLLDDSNWLEAALANGDADDVQFRSLSQQLKAGNLAYLYQHQKYIIKALNFYRQYFQEASVPKMLLTSIYHLGLASTQLSGLGYFNQVFQRLLRALRQVKFTNRDHNQRQRSLRVARNINLNLWLSRAQELKAQEKGSFIYYIQNQDRKKIPLQEYVGRHQEYFQNIRWRDIFELNQYYHSIQKSPTISRPFLFYPQEPPIHACLGCTQMFQQRTNIYDPHISPTKVSLLPAIKSLRNNSDLLREEMCGLLNGGGGVILFDCSIAYLDVIAKGQFLAASDKIQARKQINSIVCHDIDPVPAQHEQYEVSYVPIVWKNMQVSPKRAKSQTGRQFIKDLFVVRITVRPQKQANYTLKRGVISWIIIKEYSLVSKNQWISNTGMVQQTDNQRAKSIFDHEECLDVAVVDKIKEDWEIEGDPEDSFQSTSALLVNVKHHAAIKLALLKYGIQCRIETPFGHISNLKGSEAIGLIYHDCSYQSLVKTISYNKDFMFDGKYPVVSEVSYFIKLSSKSRKHLLSREDMVSLKKWQKLINRNENIQMLEDITVNQFYIRTQSKTSTLLLFLVLLQHHQKVTIDEPANYSRYNQADSKQFLKEIYTITQALKA